MAGLMLGIATPVVAGYRNSISAQGRVPQTGYRKRRRCRIPQRLLARSLYEKSALPWDEQIHRYEGACFIDVVIWCHTCLKRGHEGPAARKSLKRLFLRQGSELGIRSCSGFGRSFESGEREESRSCLMLVSELSVLRSDGRSANSRPKAAGGVCTS